MGTIAFGVLHSSSALFASVFEGDGRRFLMDGTPAHGTSILQDVSNALVKLHKEQFGRGPIHARSGFAGPDALTCVMTDVLLPAERKMVALGDHIGVRNARMAFQAATASEFTAAIELIVSRKVRAFASAIDPDTNTVFECFTFEPIEQSGNGAVPAKRDLSRSFG
jgi:uncharacterized protein YbcI